MVGIVSYAKDVIITVQTHPPRV